MIKDSFNYNLTTDNLSNVIGIISLSIGIGIVDWHLNRTDKSSTANSASRTNKHNTSLLNSISPRLQHELLMLLNNQQVANRLLVNISISNPHNSANWVAEKVIDDLKQSTVSWKKCTAN